MTREKAIEFLKEIIEKGWLISDFEKCIAIDACEMAIEALEQQDKTEKLLSVGVLKDCESCKAQKPCTDTISIDNVIEWLKNKDIIKLSTQEEIARKELRELPFDKSLLNEKVKTAKWKHAYDEYMPYLYCSNCKLKVGLYESTNYCSNCGAKMWGGLNK